ncbi:nitrate ABC transporter substrate-binding protein [Parasulfuritortus cantonensis]|uniref:Nitrate ABC transporter substrate-binding protein n=1 Tax=Parasulfuritortus cantonensis TaxID=2528202 RepID=A0A4R1BME0_9PROT|nr:ABC transporter substrate-binding protein [Parasulfuritortus cantonensis]TCJ18575.1 nitrate ABC transporter substrate-binding protein [Parasulfuritortus cantonensis]
MHKRSFLIKFCALGIGLAGALLANGAQAASAMKIGLTTWIGYSPFYVAEALDLYKKYGIKVTLQTFPDPAALPSALSGGAIDGALMTYDQVIGAAGQGQVFKVVLPVDYSNGGDAIVAAKALAKITDLKGKKVAYAPLSPSDFLISYALKSNGMSAKDISPVNMTPEAVPAAVISGAVPAGVTYEPNVSQILAAGAGQKFHVIYSSRNAPGLIADVLAFGDKKIAANGKEIAAITQVYVEAMKYMKDKPADAAKLIGKAIGVSPKEVGEQLAGVYNIPAAEMAKSYAKGKDTTSYYTSGAIINELLVKSGQIKKPVDIATTLDDRFVKVLAK